MSTEGWNNEIEQDRLKAVDRIHVDLHIHLGEHVLAGGGVGLSQRIELLTATLVRDIRLGKYLLASGGEGGAENLYYNLHSVSSRVETPPPGQPRRRALRWLTASALVTVFVWGAWSTGYRAATIERDTAFKQAALADARAPYAPAEPARRDARPPDTDPSQIPPALAHDLEQPPQVTPPPGATAAAAARSGPSAFGFGE